MRWSTSREVVAVGSGAFVAVAGRMLPMWMGLLPVISAAPPDVLIEARPTPRDSRAWEGSTDVMVSNSDVSALRWSEGVESRPSCFRLIVLGRWRARPSPSEHKETYQLELRAEFAPEVFFAERAGSEWVVPVVEKKRRARCDSIAEEDPKDPMSQVAHRERLAALGCGASTPPDVQLVDASACPRGTISCGR